MYTGPITLDGTTVLKFLAVGNGQQTAQQSEGYVRAAAEEGARSTDQLAKLSKLHEDGSLTDEEYAAAKSKVLGD